MTSLSTQDILADKGFYVLQSPSKGLFWGPLASKASNICGQFVTFDENEEVRLGEPRSLEVSDLLDQTGTQPFKSDFTSSGRSEYEKRFRAFKSQNSAEKAVLFETYFSKCELNLEVYLFCLKRLLERNHSKDGYIYGFYDPIKKKALVGLSPEYLYTTRQDGSFWTSAVAGSQKGSEFKSWSEKLKKEHRMVEESIKDSLGGGVDFSVAETMKYGDLVHLRSAGRVKTKDTKALSKRLHPTAAVGCLPKKACKSLDLGPVDRGFYGGYAELLSLDLPFSLVTIRGLEWRRGEVKASIGGGVLKESSIDDEWNELSFKWKQFKKLWDL